jgi:hypothetical protein
MTTVSGPTKYLAGLLALGWTISVTGAETGQTGAAINSNPWAHPGAKVHSNPWAHSHQYIVQSSTALEARRNVIAVGAKVNRDLGVINGVAAHLDAAHADKLGAIAGLQIFKDRPIGTRVAPCPPR